MNERDTALSLFNTIQLGQLEEANLMRRMDIKFVFDTNHLPIILKKLTEHYNILEVNNKTINSYKSLYFDTPDFKLYTDHHNRKDHRFKVRYRTYLNGNNSYFEIKEKRKGKTNKQRILVDKPQLNLTNDSEAIAYSNTILPYKMDLKPVLWNSYERITLVHKLQKERVTLDLNIQFEWNETAITFDHFIIAELKQPKQTHRSVFYQVMKKEGIRPYRISKYCLGILNLHKDNGIKYNRFKKKLLKLNIHI